LIHGIGTDIVECARFEQLLSRYGERLAKRLLSIQELSGFYASPNPSRFLAKRFAAKEAFAKAVGSGLRAPVSLTRISVMHNGLGKPLLQFDELLHRYLAQLGIGAHHLSISDDSSSIVAFVVLEVT